MNSLPSDNQQTVNAFLVKSHQSFGLLDNVPSLIEPKSIFYVFKISSDILKGQLFLSDPTKYTDLLFQEKSNKSAEEIRSFWEKVYIISANDDNDTTVSLVAADLHNMSSNTSDLALAPSECLCNFSTFTVSKVIIKVLVCLFSSMIASKYFDHYIL